MVNQSGRIATYLITSSSDDTSSDTDTDTNSNTDTDTETDSDDDEDSSIIVYSDEAYEMLELINNLRTSVGVSTLSWSDELEEYAIIRAEEMVETGVTHYRPDGSYAGTEWGTGGEIITSTSDGNSSSAYTAWYNSTDHYSLMISSWFSQMGAGCVYSSTNNCYYWCVMFDF